MDPLNSLSVRPLSLPTPLEAQLTRTSRRAGQVAVLASVTGPTEVRIRDELVDRATLEINVRPLRGAGGALLLFLTSRRR
jgi:exosome complex component RRP46